MLDAAEPADIELAATLLRRGGLVAIPTETVYGLAANALDVRAVARIFEAKQRPAFDPLIVHVASADAAWKLVRGEVPAVARRLADTFWPGPLTITLPRADMVPELVTSGLPDVALRVPAHPVARALLNATGFPLAAPSANRFGRVSPTRAEHVLEQLDGAIDAVLDGGPCTVGVESTVVRLDGQVIEILRHGGVPREALEALGVPVRDGVRVLERPLAPGQLARHYATSTPLRLLADGPLQAPADAAARALLVVAGPAPDAASAWGHVRTLAPDGDLYAAAAELFAALRSLDRGSYAGIDVIPCANIGIGRAIVDRLQRATVRDEETP